MLPEFFCYFQPLLVYTWSFCLLYLSFSLTISHREKEEKPFNDDGLLFSLRGEKLNAYKEIILFS